MSILAAAQSSGSSHALTVIASCVALWLLVLRLKARFTRRRLARAISRAYAPGSSHRRPTVRAEHRMVARTTRSRKADRQFRKAALITALLWAAWLFVHFHPHTH